MVSLLKPARAWGLAEGSGHPSCWNPSAVALWRVVVAPFLLTTDQEVSAHPRALCAAKSSFYPPEHHHHPPSEGRGSTESSVMLVRAEEGM